MAGKLDTSTDPQVGFRPPGTLDIATALAPYSGRFGPRQAAHLLRRAGFGGSAATVAATASLGVTGAVDALLHPTAGEPDFAQYPPTDQLYAKNKRQVVQLWWLDRMLRTNDPLREKMTLFWHGHFATSVGKVEPALLARQINLFRNQGLGRFPALLSAVTQDPAMLIWLDNRYNTKAHPNENYAREVMELFGLGLGNYTEDDIKEAARAFTGWTLDYKTYTVAFDPKRHDDGTKTVLGRTGNFSADDVIAIIVQQPIHQRFLARKLLEFFLYSDPEPQLIEALAQTYALSGFDIARTVATIFRSNVFYSSRAYRAIPKSPIEFAIGVLRYMGVPTVPPNLPYQLARMGQEPLNPPSVKGWDGGPTWVTTTALLARFNFVNQLVATTGVKGAARLAAPNVDPDTLVQSTGMDPNRVAAAIVSGAIQDDVTGDVRTTLVEYLNSAHATTTAGQNPLPFGPENYQEKIRGAVALTLNLPVNQLD